VDDLNTNINRSGKLYNPINRTNKNIFIQEAAAAYALVNIPRLIAVRDSTALSVNLNSFLGTRNFLDSTGPGNTELWDAVRDRIQQKKNFQSAVNRYLQSQLED
jgi:hypothetical protein